LGLLSPYDYHGLDKYEVQEHGYIITYIYRFHDSSHIHTSYPHPHTRTPHSHPLIHLVHTPTLTVTPAPGPHPHPPTRTHTHSHTTLLLLLLLPHSPVLHPEPDPEPSPEPAPEPGPGTLPNFDIIVLLLLFVRPQITHEYCNNRPLLSTITIVIVGDYYSNRRRLL
jgi:hypothetical protein